MLKLIKRFSQSYRKLDTYQNNQIRTALRTQVGQEITKSNWHQDSHKLNLNYQVRTQASWTKSTKTNKAILL